MNILGQPMVILGSYKAVYELLEQQSSISSDRSPSPMADLSVAFLYLHVSYRQLTDSGGRTGFMWDFALEGYTQRWRTQRRAFHQLFYPNAIKAYRPTQLREVHRLLQKLITTPGNFVHHCHQSASIFLPSLVNILTIDNAHLVVTSAPRSWVSCTGWR